MTDATSVLMCVLCRMSQAREKDNKHRIGMEFQNETLRKHVQDLEKSLIAELKDVVLEKNKALNRYGYLSVCFIQLILK